MNNVKSILLLQDFKSVTNLRQIFLSDILDEILSLSINCEQWAYLEPIHEFINDIKQSSPHSVYNLLIYSDIYIWLEVNRSLRSDGKFAYNFQLWKYGKTEIEITMHILELNIFRLGLAYLNQRKLFFNNPIILSEVGTIPFIDYFWYKEGLRVYGIDKEFIYYISPDGKKTELKIGEMDEYFHKIPKLAHNLKFNVWSDVNRCNIDGTEKMRRYEKIDSGFNIILNKSLSIINDFNPSFLKLIIYLYKDLVPCYPPTEKSYPSGTCSFAPYSVFYAHSDNPYKIAELLIHESHHAILNLISHKNNFFDEQTHSSGWEKMNYYSPWRDEPRPIMGIVHGLYVFSAILIFWSHCLEKDFQEDIIKFAKSRFKTIYKQLQLGLISISNEDGLLVVPQEIINITLERLSNVKSLFEKIDSEELYVTYSEDHGKWNFTGRLVDDAISAHLESYNKNY